MTKAQLQLFSGCFLPAFAILWAFLAAWDGEVILSTRSGDIELTGLDVVLFFAAVVGGAGAFHAYQFWGNLLWNVGYAQLGQIAGLCLLAGAVVAIVARQFLNFL